MGLTLNLALQGGGAHGAYTCGVLERLLDEPDITIEGVSGTSAGAINAALLAQGLTEGGPAHAKEVLASFWTDMAQYDVFSPLYPFSLNPFMRLWNLDANPFFEWTRALSMIFSPYMLNPFDVNPLRDMLEERINMDDVRACTCVKLFVTATRVSDGHPRIFRNEEITTETLLASACLPYMYRAVEIDGEAYWDGGYTGNPAIWPLIYHCESRDVLLVQINPVRRRERVPLTGNEIMNRLNEITFNSNLIGEMRAIDFVRKLIREGKLSAGDYKDMRMHMIHRPEEMMRLNGSSKLNVSGRFFRYLRGLGRQACDEWLEKHKRDIGVRSALDINNVFAA